MNSAERGDLVESLSRAERLTGDLIASYLFRCRSLTDSVSVVAGALAREIGDAALDLAARLGRMAAEVDGARGRDR